MNILGGIFKNLKDCIFPVFCIECQEEGQWWCEQCRSKITIGFFACPVCHSLNSDGSKCFGCLGKSDLDRVVSFFEYKEKSPQASLIHNFKYNFAFEVASIFQKIAEKDLKKVISSFDTKEKTMVIPIPLHKSRFKERGFNQSEIIAKFLPDILGGNYFLNLDLKRTKKTEQQAKLSKVERLSNTRAAFEWLGEGKSATRVILVDDVYTSGATMSECAGILKKNGAELVCGFTVARG